LAVNKRVIDDNLGCSKTIFVKELSWLITLTDPTSIANKFNEYFTHSGPNLADKIPYISGSHVDYMNNTVSKSMFIKPTNVYEIKKIISELHNGKSPGYDGFSAKVLKLLVNLYVNHCLLSVILHLLLAVFQID